MEITLWKRRELEIVIVTSICFSGEQMSRHKRQFDWSFRLSFALVSMIGYGSSLKECDDIGYESA